MEIKAGSYTLKSDSLGNFHILETIEKTADGVTKSYGKRVSGYCRTPLEAVEDMFKRKVYSSDATSLEEVVRVITTEMDKAIELIKGE